MLLVIIPQLSEKDRYFLVEMLCNNGFMFHPCSFLSHLLPPYDGGRYGWEWTSWTFPPPPESSPTVGGGLSLRSIGVRQKIEKQHFRKEPLSCRWQSITMGGRSWAFLRFLSTVPKAFALWTILALWSLNISLAVTSWADCHAVFPGLKDLPAYFSPRAEKCFFFFPVSEHTSRHPP